MGLQLVPHDVVEYDFDRLRSWCRQPSAAGIDYSAFLNAWNFFDDLAGLHDNPGTAYARLSRGAGRGYDKLFWGSNLPSVTPPGEWFTPSWGADELDSIRRVLEAGLGLVQGELLGRDSFTT